MPHRGELGAPTMPRTPLLAKLTRPRTHHAVARPRLFAMLDAARDRPLIWISAPPGSGKTTLAATYFDARAERTLWYQVDSGDRDPASFFGYLRRAPRKASRGSRLPQLAPEHLGDLGSFCKRFFRAFFANLESDETLVFDNFQEADDVLAELLHHATREVPAGICITVISRGDPPPLMMQLDARGLLAKIGWEDIQLTLEETRAVCALRSMEEDWIVQALHKQAGGWAAGVVLMLERFRRAGEARGVLPDETRDGVFSYFASLIFEQSPKKVQQTLLAVAFVPLISPELAVQLSGDPSAPKILESLHRRQLFTSRHGAAKPVYQFHAMFRAFLESQLRSRTPPSDWTDHCKRVADALTADGQWEAAFDVLLTGAAVNEAADLLIDHAAGLLDSGRWQTILRAADRLPGNTAQTKPWLRLWIACATAQTRPAAAIEMFESIYGDLTDRDLHAARRFCIAHLLTTCLVDHVDYNRVDAWLEVLSRDCSEPDDDALADNELLLLGAFVSAVYFCRPWDPHVIPAFDRIDALLPRASRSGIALVAASNAVLVASHSAQRDRAARLTDIILHLIEKPEISIVWVVWALLQAGHAQFLLAHYDEAIALYRRVWSVAQANGLQKVLGATLIHRYALDFRFGDIATADESMRKIEALPPPQHTYHRAMLDCFRARHAQLHGAHEQAAALAVRSQEGMILTGAAYHRAHFGLINAEILLAAGRPDLAKPVVSAARETISRATFCGARASAMLVEAWLAMAEDRRDEGLKLLQDALRMSRDNFAWSPMRYTDTTLAHMLPIALEENVEADQVRWLIRTFRLRPPASDVDQWPWPCVVRTLGQFSVQLDERPLLFGRKTPKKVLALLKAIIAAGPRDVSEEQLIDALWPDEEGDAAHRALGMTLLRLRRLLGDNELVRQQGGKLSLDRRRCWVDAWSFEQRLMDVRSDPLVLERTLTLYGGTFLPDDLDAPITVATRERLRFKFVDALSGLGNRLEASAQHEAAIRWYLLGLEADPIIEAFYQGLMRSYVALDRRTEAVSAYRRLKHTLAVTLGLQPSPSTERLYQRLV